MCVCNSISEDGFVVGDFDIQVNGYAGADFCSRSLTLEQCRRACDELAADGVTELVVDAQDTTY